MSIISSELLLGAAEAGGGYEIERSVRFEATESAYIERTPTSASNQKTWTWSGWVKRTTLANLAHLFSAGTDVNNRDQLHFQGSGDTLAYLAMLGGTFTYTYATGVFRDPSAWYHIVCAVDTTQATSTDRVKLYVNGVDKTDTASSGYPPLNQNTQINRTVPHANKLPYTAGQYPSYQLSEVYFVDGQALDPTSFGEFDSNGIWQPIAYSGSYGTNGFHLDFADNSTAAALGTDTSGNGNDWTVNNLVATAPEYSPYYSLSPGGSFYGVNQSTYAARNLFDGSITSPVLLAASTTITYSFPVGIAFSSSFEIYYTHEGAGQTVTVNGVSQSLNNNYPTRQWLNVTGITSPVTSISWTGIGASGPYMYAVRVDGVNIIVDGGPNCDSLLDSPTNGTQADTGVGGEVSGNYCTFNPIGPGNAGTASWILSNGNLNANDPADCYGVVPGTIGASSGKYYWEISFSGGTVGSTDYWGIERIDQLRTNRYPGNYSNAYWFRGDGNKVDGIGSAVSYGSSFTTSNVAGVAFDADNGTLTFYKDGVSLGTAFTGIDTSLAWRPVIGNAANVTSITNWILNAGQRAFAYTAPSGYKALCTTNLPTPTIEKGSDYFGTKLYTGNGSTQSISGLDFSPDLVWIKNRAAADNHKLLDTVRGATNELESNTTDAEVANADGLTAFNSDGFTLGADVEYNTNTETYVAWNWDAGSSNSTVSVGTYNSSYYTQSATYSNDVTSSGGYSTNRGPDKGFDGLTRLLINYPSQTYCQAASTGGSVTWTPSGSPISTAGGNVRVAAISSTDRISVVGSTGSASNLAPDASNNWTLPDVGNLTSFTISNPVGLGGFSGVSVGDKVLVDSGVSLPVDFPSIASTIRTNPSAGFSIVTYTGTGSVGTIGHGLGVAPHMIITKSRGGVTDWGVYHASRGATGYLRLNLTNAFSVVSTAWNDTAPTSTVFAVGTNTRTNDSNPMVAYCFAPVEAYSAFGSYTGNGGSDGPFVYTGFRPRWVLIKNSSAVGSWILLDTARDTYNVAGLTLSPDANTAESGNDSRLDFLSNGFKIRNSYSNQNSASAVYVWAAFAENPFNSARAR